MQDQPRKYRSGILGFFSNFLYAIYSAPRPVDLEILRLLHGQRAQGVSEMKTIDDLLSAVSAQTTLVGSVVTLIQNLRDQVTAAQGDPAKIDAAFDAIQAETDALTNALTANTPTAPPADTTAPGDSASTDTTGQAGDAGSDGGAAV